MEIRFWPVGITRWTSFHHTPPAIFTESAIFTAVVNLPALSAPSGSVRSPIFTTRRPIRLLPVGLSRPTKPRPNMNARRIAGLSQSVGGAGLAPALGWLHRCHALAPHLQPMPLHPLRVLYSRRPPSSCYHDFPGCQVSISRDSIRSLTRVVGTSAPMIRLRISRLASTRW